MSCSVIGSIIGVDGSISEVVAERRVRVPAACAPNPGFVGPPGSVPAQPVAEATRREWLASDDETDGLEPALERFVRLHGHRLASAAAQRVDQRGATIALPAPGGRHGQPGQLEAQSRLPAARRPRSARRHRASRRDHRSGSCAQRGDRRRGRLCRSERSGQSASRSAACGSSVWFEQRTSQRRIPGWRGVCATVTSPAGPVEAPRASPALSTSATQRLQEPGERLGIGVRTDQRQAEPIGPEELLRQLLHLLRR